MSPLPNLRKYNLIVDENVRREVVEFLKEVGCDVKIPAKGLKNGQVLRLAIDEERILITHDKDFLDPLLYPSQATSGVILIRIHPPTVSTICAALDALFNKLSPQDFKKKLVILEKDGFRIK